MAKSRKKKKRNQSSKLKAKIVLFVVASAILALSLLWQNQINSLLGLVSVQEGDYTGTNAQVIRADGGDLVVHFIDVGQGDACVVELPDGRNLIIDAGPGKYKAQLLTYLTENFSFRRFDFAILTHSDEDHAGGFADVLNLFSVGTFYRPNELSTRAPYADPDAANIVGSGKKDTVVYRNTIEAAYRASDEVVVTYMPDLEGSGHERIVPDGKTAGDAGYYEIVFFGPYGHSYKNLNDYSPIIIIEYEEKRIALTGDAEKTAEEEFVAAASLKSKQAFTRFTDSYTVNVVKLGHHGSRTSSSEAFLNTLTTPASVSDVLVVISVNAIEAAKKNWEHPHSEVLSRLSTLGFSSENILRTDQNGSIVLSVRYDTDANAYLLFYGASAQNITETAPVTWMEIAIGIWVLLAIILFAAPLFKTPKNAKKRR